MRKLATKTNVQAPDGQYPYGRIKNNDGSQNGTPVDENTYGDIHQFFEKLMAAAGITANGFPENQYSGFQLNEALQKLIDDASINNNRIFRDKSYTATDSCDDFEVSTITHANGDFANAPTANSGDEWIIQTVRGRVTNGIVFQLATQITGSGGSGLGAIYRRKFTAFPTSWSAWTPINT